MEREGKILLLKRANTGYADGKYQMPSGSIEPQEYASEAAIREAKEEVGVDIRPEDLEFIHVSHRLAPSGGNDWIDFFFRTERWEGEPVNAEPHKCDGLLWASIDDLPEDTVEVVKEAVAYVRKNLALSEIGRASS